MRGKTYMTTFLKSVNFFKRLENGDQTIEFYLTCESVNCFCLLIVYITNNAYNQSIKQREQGSFLKATLGIVMKYHSYFLCRFVLNIIQEFFAASRAWL